MAERGMGRGENHLSGRVSKRIGNFYKRYISLKKMLQSLYIPYKFCPFPSLLRVHENVLFQSLCFSTANQRSQVAKHRTEVELFWQSQRFTCTGIRPFDITQRGIFCCVSLYRCHYCCTVFYTFLRLQRLAVARNELDSETIFDLAPTRLESCCCGCKSCRFYDISFSLLLCFRPGSALHLFLPSKDALVDLISTLFLTSKLCVESLSLHMLN